MRVKSVRSIRSAGTRLPSSTATRMTQIVWPFRWIPILIAENFAGLAMWNRMIPVVYIILTFYILPILVIWLGR